MPKLPVQECPLKFDDVINLGDGSTRTVKDVLLSLHPEGQAADPNALLDESLPTALPMNPIIIKNVASRSKGSHGLIRA